MDGAPGIRVVADDGRRSISVFYGQMLMLRGASG